MSVPVYPNLRESGFQWLGQIPESWASIPFGLLFRRTKRVGYADEELLSVYRDYGVIRKSDRDDNFNNASEDLSTYQLVEPGDLAMNKMKAWQGSLGISDHRGIVSPAYFVFTPRREYHPQFLHHLLRSPPYAAGYMTISKGIRINQWDVDPDHLSALPVLFPSVEEQTAIAAFLDRETAKIDALVVEQERLIALLKEKRQAVISHAVTKGLNPNAPMKDSGIEWLGQIPAYWSVSKIKFATSHVVDCLHTTPTYDGELLYPTIRTADVDRGVLLLKQARLVSQEIYDERIQRLKPIEGDVLYSREGERFGIAALVPPEIKLCLGQRMMMFRATDDFDPAYLMWGLNSDAVYQQVISDIGGATSPHVNISDVINFSIPSPPKDEQAAIASTISRRTANLDALVSETQSAVTLLQERRAALISAAVTGKIDVRGTIGASNVIPIDHAREKRDLPSLRAIVGVYAIRELGSMGRMAVMKAGYLAEVHAGFDDLRGRYERYAAGPYDQSLISGMESGAGEICAIQTIEPQGTDKPVKYNVPKGFQAPSDALEALVGEDRSKGFQAMLSLLKGLGRDGVEAVATIYAVWNDLLAVGKSADDDAICDGVLNDWHDEKRKKFKRSDLDHWLAWMRRNGFVPDGSAPRTDYQGSLFA